MAINFIKKRDGKLIRFNPEKVRGAILKAAHSSYAPNPEEIVKNVFERVKTQIEVRFNGKPPAVADIEEIIISSSRETGYDNVANSYQTYRDKRVRAKQVLAIMSQRNSINSTDSNLLIESDSKEIQGVWERERIVSQLQQEANLDYELAKDISKKVENIIVELYDRGIRKLKTTHVRTLVDLILTQEGLETERKKQELLGIPVKDLENAIIDMNHENSNVASNNPEAVNLFIAEAILKPYALENVFSKEIAEAHLNGTIHLHDLGYIDRVYCSSHSLEYIKKFGLKKLLDNLESKSNSPNSAAVLNQHVQTFLASLQSRYAGALGFGFLNIFYAPLLQRPTDVINGEINNQEWNLEKRDLEKLIEQGELTENPSESLTKKFFNKKSERKELKELPYHEFEQVAQNLIFAASQNAFSRGGQTLFIDFNIHTGIPEYLKNVPAIGPKGKYMIQKTDGTVEMIDDAPRIYLGDIIDPRNGDADQSKVQDGRILTYGDFEKTAQKFAKALMEVWKKGDSSRRPFHFPKCDLHVDKNSFDGGEQEKLIDLAAEIAAENGSPYFMFDRGDGAVLAQCCRLKEKIEDPSILKHPERLRFCGFQNVTVNLAQAALKGKNLESTLKEIDYAMSLALKAHMQKREYIQKLLDTDGSPMRGLGIPSDDGTPYVDLKKSTYIIGNIGLNEAVQVLTGKQLHENEETYRVGLRIVAHMYKNIQEFKKSTGLKYAIEETPAESTTRRLAKVDLKYFPEANKIVKGTPENPYYTNSIHLAPNANVSGTDRTVAQSKFHQMIESGAIVHKYIGEQRPDAASIKEDIKKTLLNTHCSQLVYSPTYTECDSCGNVMPGEKELCTDNGCTNHSKETLNPKKLFPVTRIVGYYSRIKNWNGSQKQIYEDRKTAEKQYADMGGETLDWLYKPNHHETLQILQFGKEDCPTCENLKENVGRVLSRLGLEGKIDYKINYLNQLNEEELVQAAMYDVPLDTVPTIVIAGKNDYWKKTTQYAPKYCASETCNVSAPKPRTDHIRSSEIEEAITRRIGEYSSLQ